MDVSAPRPPEAIDAAIRRLERTPPVEATPETTETPPQVAAAGERWTPPSSLKFTLSAADVDARFEIHEATSVVTVTMYERTTGEILREIPSREVLDVIASLTGTGLRVDAIS